ncbi:hypothetical protein IQ62_26720 [Streptomyces scabiei]|nr:hypothetical protein IQ62_26720 [Streptomyces scabiei]
MDSDSAQALRFGCGPAVFLAVGFFAARFAVFLGTALFLGFSIACTPASVSSPRDAQARATDSRRGHGIGGA